MTPDLPLRIAAASEWRVNDLELANATVAMQTLPKEATAIFWRVEFPDIRYIAWPSGQYLMLCRGRQPIIANHWPQFDQEKAKAWNEAMLNMRLRLHGPINLGRTPCDGIIIRRRCVIAVHAKPEVSILHFSPDVTGHDRLDEIEELARDYPGLFVLV